MHKHDSNDTFRTAVLDDFQSVSLPLHPRTFVPVRFNAETDGTGASLVRRPIPGLKVSRDGVYNISVNLVAVYTDDYRYAPHFIEVCPIVYAHKKAKCLPKGRLKVPGFRDGAEIVYKLNLTDFNHIPLHAGDVVGLAIIGPTSGKHSEIIVSSATVTVVDVAGRRDY